VVAASKHGRDTTVTEHAARDVACRRDVNRPSQLARDRFSLERIPVTGRLIAAIAASVILTSTAPAQITTSAVGGRVVAEGGAPVAQAEVVAIHVPTGARFGVKTAEDGRYLLANVRAGGPYTITVRRIGYQAQSRDTVDLALGTTARFDFVLQNAAATLSAVTVTASRDATLSPEHTGPATSVNRELIENLPTLSRSLQDMTRLMPQANANSFGGMNFRYNNITVDGASANDVFSFSNSYGGISGVGPSGTPGAAAKSQPISLDAIEQIRVALAPFDVKLGNFGGASVNAVTRSGSNKTEGSVYSYGRNQSLTGKSADAARTAMPAYHDYQAGGRVGGALRTDKAFYFVSGEIARRREPVQFAPGDPGTIVDAVTAHAIADTLRTRYGYDAGALGAYTIDANSTKLFGRLDFNLSDEHKLSIRHNFVSADAGQLQRGPTAVNFGGQDFVQKTTNNSTVAELKSNLANGLGNDLVAGLTFTRDHRDPVGSIFPQLEISGPSGSTLLIGTNREAAVFQVNTNIFELTDNATLYHGINTITFGTHNELYGIQYTFQNAWNGRWQYGSIANFFADRPSRIRGTYALGDNSYAAVLATPVADFKVLWPSAYVQDEVALSERLRVTAGLRFDDPVFPDKPAVNQAFVNTNYNGTTPFAKYTNDFGGDIYVQPRVSFNWDVNGDQSLQLRGGTGIFVSRVPFAWLAYGYYNNGGKYNNIDCRPGPTADCAGNNAVVPLVTDPSQLRTLQTGVYEMNVIDDGFKMPTMERSSLGVDYRLPDGTVMSFEGMYTKTIKDVKFLNVGLKDTTSASPVDGRPIYLGSPVQLRVNPSITSVFLITNTSEGSRYSLTGRLSRNVGPFSLMGAYTYGSARDISNGIRNSPQSNWEFNQAAAPNAPALSASNFDVRHRLASSFTWTTHERPDYEFGISGFFSAVSGAPFTFTYTSDYNRDGAGNNDLVYVPRDEADARIVPAAGDTRSAHDIWLLLDSFINSQPNLANHRGRIAERNAGNTPWNKQLDLRLHQDLPIAARRVQITLDVVNALAVFGSSWGRQYFVPNENNYQVPLLRVTRTDANGAPSGFSFDGIPNNTPWQYDALNSRYQAQLGLRYSF